MQRSLPARGSRADGATPAWALGMVGIVGLVALLELAPRIGLVDPRFLPPISEIFVALGAAMSDLIFWGALVRTLYTWLVGLAISLVAGVVLGVLIGSIPVLREFTASTIEFLRPVPSVALIPVAVLVLGPTGIGSTLLLVVYASFWQVLIQVMAGVEDVDPVASDTARSYRFRSLTRVRTLTWPTTLPYAMTGLRLAASVALILTVTGELLISGSGLGGLVAIARQSGAIASMYAYIVVTGALGLLINVLSRGVERKTLFWHPSVRVEEVA